MQALTERRLVTEETVGGLKVCRVCARGVYRVLGAEDVRFRRITSSEVAVRRLLSFDYVIKHPGLPWLPTESEKVGAFEALGIDRSLMPVRVYRGAAGGARRYFPRGMPVALNSRRAVFVHADPGYDTSTALHSWRDRYKRLWEALREDGLSVEAVGVACARRPLDRARTILGNWTNAGSAPFGPSRRHDRRPFGVAFAPACRSPDLSAVRRSPLPIRRCAFDIGVQSPQTVLRCYQQADAGQLRTALESRPRTRT
ncbi:MAG: hypothetical protein OXI83_08795 [Gemmatimonadota bacterium]|nr:hypothetical protein [Gemmatimonadota bacterium]